VGRIFCSAPVAPGSVSNRLPNRESSIELMKTSSPSHIASIVALSLAFHLTNSALAQIGPGSALALSGTAHGVLQSNASLTLSNQFTLEAWINPQAKVCNSIISRGNGATAATDYN